MAQSQTPPNTMIVVNSLPLKKKTKNTFFFQPPFEILTSFSSLFLVSCLCRCIHHYFCSLHTSHEGRSRVFAIHSCEWAEGRVKRRWIWSCACVHVHGKTDVCLSLSAHCRVFDSFLVFTSNPLGTICHSLLHSVHYLHLSPLLPSLCLSRCSAPPLFSLLSGSIFCFFSFFFKFDFYFQPSALFLYWTLTHHLCLPTFLKISR